jgi:excisionase family DNA binding protein
MPSPDSDTTEPVVYTVPQAAKVLQVSENHLYSLVAQDLVPYVRFGKLIRIPRWGLLQYLAAASGAPIPANLAVAIQPVQSADGQRPTSEEG